MKIKVVIEKPDFCCQCPFMYKNTYDEQFCGMTDEENDRCSDVYERCPLNQCEVAMTAEEFEEEYADQ